MIVRLRIGRWRFSFSMAPVADIVGVNSTLPSGNHIIMWDFDDTESTTVIKELRRIQRKYRLPTIYILSTGQPNSFIAYCFKETPWRKAVEIIAATEGVCWNFIKYGVYRGHFTLRVSLKCGRKPRIIRYLLGRRKQDCTPQDLWSWTRYETIEDRWPVKVIEVGGRTRQRTGI